MIQSLRKKHKIAWLILAMLLPLGFFLAVSSIPPHLGSTVVEGEITAHLLENGEDKILEVVVKGHIKSGFANLYTAASDTDDIEKAILLGPLHGTGTYRYQLGPDTAHENVIIYDQFKNQMIQSIKVKAP